MADAAVEFLLENLKQLLLHHAHLISDAKNQVEKLENDLRLFKAFLKDSTKKRRTDESLRELVRQIRDVVYEAEDIIDASVTQAAESRSKKYFGSLMAPARLHNIAEQVQTVRRKISDIYGGKDKIDLANLALGDAEPEIKPENQAPVVRQENVVGFEDEAKKLIGYLNQETEHLDIISIIGMPGLGKTTLAGMIFRDPKIHYEFPTRIWVYVSQEFTNKDIFLAILRKIITNFNEAMYTQKSAAELAQEVATHLQRGKFLIVMDDVWTADDWEKLQIAFPKSNNNGKILITSRQVEVARFANRNRPPHDLRFLTQEESWLLLRWEVFGKPECPTELCVLGQRIAEQCEGLPLAIVVIGGILARMSSTAWERVSTSVSTYLTYEDPQKRMEKIISLSYEKLPYHLKECFLYLGMFPEDFEIPVWKLIRIWIAEGLIQQRDMTSLEETAENYLDELINRNLVRIDKRKADGKVKTCRIHDMLRDFCKNEASYELQEIKMSGDLQKCRRLCIHSNYVLNFLSSKPHGPRVRSFVCFNKDEFNLPNDKITAIPAAFKLLRVLDVKPLKFAKLPSDLYHLIHLRYIALTILQNSSSKPAILPKAFAKLWNIQTIIIDTTARSLDIQADILNMVQLRHLKTNASATLLKPDTSSSKEGEKLQTLGTISPKNCTEEIFDRARNLKKLGIRGKLALLLDGKSRLFDSLRKLGNLENLKLVNDAAEKLGGLPPAYKFPTKLRSLTISGTSLDWSQISVLGMLETLEVLKLKEKAFVGDCWEAADGGFRRLVFLHIERTDLALWIALGHHFPKLRRLEVRNCEKLKEIPIGLADVPCLQLLDLYRTKHAVASARKILKAKIEQQEKATTNIGLFKLSIFPPDE
ncbi:putative late blight resistance protein homolog r1a-6 [Phtheirospermum japonicum]|uniref:Putative late blight resistance protein homolog r1a-6 n=1 Tax=Phtheirospermum japonicum TaxID=374723 RepID=A0A830BNX0_9LAMI|nr:putative late blight resistance protein homolog r1a-6 [Phtheirospermum japonicum]